MTQCGSTLNHYFDTPAYRQKAHALKIPFHVGTENTLRIFSLLTRTPATAVRGEAEKDD